MGRVSVVQTLSRGSSAPAQDLWLCLKGVTILSCPDLFPPPADGCFLDCQSWGGGEQDMESGLQEKGLHLGGRGAGFWLPGCEQPGSEGDRMNCEWGHHTAKEKVSRGVRCRREASHAWPRSGRSLLSGMIDWVCPSGRRKGEAKLQNQSIWAG